MQGNGDAPRIAGATIIDIGRKELFECGFEFCGPPITEAFAAAGIAITLDHDRELPAGIELDDDHIARWLWVDDRCLIERYGAEVRFGLADGSTNGLAALDWDLVSALRERYGEGRSTEENWHLGGVDDGYLLILCTSKRLAELPNEPDFIGYDVVDLTDATEIERGTDLDWGPD